MGGKNGEITGKASEICLWKHGEQCKDCDLNLTLFCQPTNKYRIIFGTTSFLGIIPAIIGTAVSGFETGGKVGIILGYIAYMFFFLNFWESRMLCNHCPYYANDSESTLNCPIDKGKLKTGNYDPGPASKFEKAQFIVGTSILSLYFQPFLLFKDMWFYSLLSLLGVIIWALVSIRFVCPHCVNFSCPMNQVPHSIRDEFIKKNPLIKDAWEKAGYNFD